MNQRPHPPARTHRLDALPRPGTIPAMPPTKPKGKPETMKPAFVLPPRRQDRMPPLPQFPQVITGAALLPPDGKNPTVSSTLAPLFS